MHPGSIYDSNSRVHKIDQKTNRKANWIWNCDMLQKTTKIAHCQCGMISSLLYALRVLRSHGIPSTSLQDVFRVTVVAKVTHILCASLVWHLFSGRLRADSNHVLSTSKHY